MKPSQMLFAAALVAFGATGAHAATPPPDDLSYFTVPTEQNTRNLDAIMKGYANALKSDNPGVVGSALAHVAYIAIWMPQARLSEVKERVQELARTGSTPTMQFRAYLVNMALDSPRLFAHLRTTNFSDDEEFYAALSRTLQVTLLGYWKAE